MPSLISAIWIISLLLSIDNKGQFVIGLAGFLSIIVKRENKIHLIRHSGEDITLSVCFGIASALVYTWIRWDAVQNIDIMFTKRYLLLTIYLLSLSTLLISTKVNKISANREQTRKTWAYIISLFSLSVALTLPFAKSAMNMPGIIIYALTALLASTTAAKLAEQSRSKYHGYWSTILTISTLTLSYFCESRIIEFFVIMTTIGVFTSLIVKANKGRLLRALNRMLTTSQSIAIYIFAVFLPLMTLASPWIIQKAPAWPEKLLWTTTGSRFFLTWSNNLWSSETLNLLKALGSSIKINYLHDPFFYNEYLTEFYGRPFSSLKQIQKYLGHAHSDPIQKLLNIFMHSNITDLFQSILSILLISIIIATIFCKYIALTNTTDEKLTAYLLGSNLLIIAYLTTESFSAWQPILILSTQAICLHTLFGQLNNTAIKNRDPKLIRTIKPESPMMLFIPYILLFFIPGALLISDKISRAWL